MKKVSVLLMVAALVTGAQAYTIVNGDIENNSGNQSADVLNWYDMSGDWWNGSGVIIGLSPSGSAAVLFGSNEGWAQLGYIYQNIGAYDGTDATISFDYGQPSDGGTNRFVSVTYDIYQGAFAGADGTDIAGAGLTLIASGVTPIVNDLDLHSFSEALDLSGATVGQDLWLRLGNVDNNSAGDWVSVDNITIPEPATMLLLGLGGLLLRRKR
jgi:hypothetical protein